MGYPEGAGRCGAFRHRGSSASEGVTSEFAQVVRDSQQGQRAVGLPGGAVQSLSLGLMGRGTEGPGPAVTPGSAHAHRSGLDPPISLSRPGSHALQPFWGRCECRVSRHALRVSEGSARGGSGGGPAAGQGQEERDQREGTGVCHKHKEQGRAPRPPGQAVWRRGLHSSKR